MNDQHEVAAAEFDAAVEIARHALEQFRNEPLVPAKRGGSRLSSWWVVWRDSSAVAQRWHREIARVRREDKPPAAWQDEFDEFDRLLGEGS